MIQLPANPVVVNPRVSRHGMSTRSRGIDSLPRPQAPPFPDDFATFFREAMASADPALATPPPLEVDPERGLLVCFN